MSHLVLGLALLCAAHSGASGSIIIFDTFTAADNTALIGRAPSPTNLPVATYAGNGNASLVGGPTGGTPYEADIQANAARLGGDVGVALNLGISTATVFEIAFTFNITGDTQTQANDPHRGAGLGFYSSVAVGSGGSSHGFNNFTGLVVDSTGSIRLIVAGANSGTFTTIAGFDPSITHTLSYQVDTTTGAGTISSIFLDSSSVSLTAPINTFTIARTTYAGFYNSSGNITDLANFPDFYVATVPEATLPGTTLGFGLIALTAIHHRCLRQRTKRRKHRAAVFSS